jgi:hypothetical protein
MPPTKPYRITFVHAAGVVFSALLNSFRAYERERFLVSPSPLSLEHDPGTCILYNATQVTMTFRMPSSVLVATAFVVLGHLVAAADECQPVIWDKRATLEVGEVNCRYDITTGPDLGLYSCESIAAMYETTVDKLLDLNPGLDCAALQPNTTYCVDGCEFFLFAIQHQNDQSCNPTSIIVDLCTRKFSSHFAHTMGVAAPILAAPPALEQHDNAATPRRGRAGRQSTYAESPFTLELHELT